MNKVKSFGKKLWADESAQGMLEYVLLAVAIVAILATFKGKLSKWIGDSSGKIEAGVNEVGSGN